MTWLWDQLHEWFDTNDGSLPELELRFEDKLSIIKAFAWLSERSTLDPPIELYSIDGSSVLSFNSIDDAAGLVVTEKAQAIHILLRSLEFNGTIVPDLGCFLTPDGITFDYRMGEEWNASTLEAFFAILLQLCSFDPEAYLLREEVAEHALVFQYSWSRFIAEHTA